MPFNTKTPIGHAIAEFVQFVVCVFLLTSVGCILCLLGGICWLLIETTEDIGREFNDLNGLKDKTEKFKIKLHEIIEFHCTTKQLTENPNYSNEREDFINNNSFADSLLIFRIFMNLSSPVTLYGVCRRFVARYS